MNHDIQEDLIRLLTTIKNFELSRREHFHKINNLRGIDKIQAIEDLEHFEKDSLLKIFSKADVIAKRHNLQLQEQNNERN